MGAPFTQTGRISLAATTTSQAVQLPAAGSPSTVYITNLSQTIVFVLLGGSTVAVTPATGTAVLPGASVALGLGSSTYLAAIALGAAAGSSTLDIAVGS
jgi:hypothetical protein